MRVNLIPMSGAGERFSKAEFKLPKPLIPVSGEPMILKVIKDMPSADRWIFVVREQHVEDFRIDKLLKEQVKNAEIIVEENPKGQLMTCLFAENHIDPDDSLLIASCDGGYLYDKARYEKLCVDEQTDAVVWTFTAREILRSSPASWGWCKLGKDQKTIAEVSVKKPVSTNPYNDHAITATFMFKKAADFFESARLVVDSGEKINGEFYVDSVPNQLKNMEKKAAIFDVDLYVGWGRPEDLYEYEFMEYACRFGSVKLNEEQSRLLPLWKTYFKFFDL